MNKINIDYTQLTFEQLQSLLNYLMPIIQLNDTALATLPVDSYTLIGAVTPPEIVTQNITVGH